MFELAIIGAWAEFAVRWLHVVTAVAWIGSSFYFIALDLGLRKAANLPEGAHGEEWQVHGGGFYHIQKYLVAPAQMPEHLTWFKWESYFTWMTGFALLCLVYYLGAEFYLIDPEKLDLPVWGAIAISFGSLVFGWLAYNQLCKLFVNANQTTLMIALFVVLVGMAYFYDQIFTGRAALLHLGAFTATMMSGNVFLVIIPNQQIVVADLIAGKKPDAKYGKIAKQRSTHNNYLTLPVIFLMLSNHYPLAFGTEYNWVIAALVFLMGVTIRHWFNTRHARKGSPYWTWAATAALFLAIVWLSTFPGEAQMEADEEAALTPTEQLFAANTHFEEVRDIVMGRCSMCHAAEPGWEGIIVAPRGVKFETDKQITSRARQIYLQAGRSHAMPPPGAATMGVELAPEERRMLVEWYESSLRG